MDKSLKKIDKNKLIIKSIGSDFGCSFVCWAP